jgi:hypothetical protein
MILTLSDLIARVESNWNPYAVRYEPAFKPSSGGVDAMAKLCHCSRATAAVLCAMSWGLFQIMGENLISLGLDVTPMEFCANESKQVALFTQFVTERGIAYLPSEIKDDHLKRERFALKYNGPGNIAAYSERLFSFLNGEATT